MYLSATLKVDSRLYTYMCANNNYRRGYELKRGDMDGTGWKEGGVEII